MWKELRKWNADCLTYRRKRSNYMNTELLGVIVGVLPFPKIYILGKIFIEGDRYQEDKNTKIKKFPIYQKMGKRRSGHEFI